MASEKGENQMGRAFLLGHTLSPTLSSLHRVDSPFRLQSTE